MKLIKDLWNGDVSLVMTYWVYGVVFTNITIVALTFALEATPLANMLSVWLIFFLLVIALVVHVTVSIWNSSKKYIAEKKSESKSAFWGYAARVVLVIGLLRALGDTIQAFNAPY